MAAGPLPEGGEGGNDRLAVQRHEGAKTLPFDTGALEALHEISRGNLRAADGLALERAARSKKTVVGAQHVAEARQELYP